MIRTFPFSLPRWAEEPGQHQLSGKVKRCQLLLLIRERQFALGFELETPRLHSGPGSLPVLWAWAGSFTFSPEPQFLHLWNGWNHTYFTGLWWGLRSFRMCKCLADAPQMLVTFSFAFSSEREKDVCCSVTNCCLGLSFSVEWFQTRASSELSCGFLLSWRWNSFQEIGADKRKYLSLEPHICQSFIFIEKPLRWCTINFDFSTLPFSCGFEKGRRNVL